MELSPSVSFAADARFRRAAAMIGARSPRTEGAIGRNPAAVRPGTPAPAPVTRTEAVREALRQAIVGRRLRPGERLPESTIGNEFGVSRTIVREAFGRLAVQGLVELKPKRGAFVANPSVEEGEEAFAVRRGLERTIAECLAGRLTAAQVEELRAFVSREASPADGADAVSRSEEFHLLLARLTGNQVLVRFMTEILSRCTLVLAARGRPDTVRSDAARHGAIADALIAGDAARAGALVDEHIAGLVGPPPFPGRSGRAQASAPRRSPAGVVNA